MPMAAMAEDAGKRRPRATGGTAASTDAGVGAGVGLGVSVRWLQAIGLCPYVVVGTEGACRVGWLPAAWCAVHLLLTVALQVSANVVEVSILKVVGLSETSIVAIAGSILLSKGEQVILSGTCLLMLLLSPRLPRLVREMAALQNQGRGLNPTGPQRLDVISLVFLWLCVVLYLLQGFKHLYIVITDWGGTWWVLYMLIFFDWVVSFLCFPTVVLLFSGELRRLQAATRAVLPPRWEHLVTEVRDEATDVHYSKPWCVPTASATPNLAPFLRRARVALLQTEEVHNVQV